MILYHLSAKGDFSVLEPHQAREGESTEYGLFLCPTLKDVRYWHERLVEEREVSHPYLYQVALDPSVQIIWTDGDRVGTRRRWDGGKTWMSQVWVEFPMIPVSLQKFP